MSTLANIELITAGDPTEATGLSVVIDLDPDVNKWEAAESVGHGEPPAGATLRLQVVVPGTNRLIFEAALPGRTTSGAEAAYVAGWIAERLSTLKRE